MVRPAAAACLALATAVGCGDRLEFNHRRADQPNEPSPLGPTGSFRLTFDEECEGTGVDSSKFNTFMRVGSMQFRSWGQRQDYMADENVSMRSGECVITAENRASGDQPYTSGTLNTAGLFAQQYGFFEARLSAPAGNGFWSVFWLRSLDGWPPAIDLVDLYGDTPNRFDASYWWTISGDPLSEYVRSAATDVTGAFHVYGVDWRPGYIGFYLDGALFGEFSPPTFEINVPLYPTFNLSIATTDEGRVPPDASTPWPAQLRIDWLRVYEAQ